MLEITLEHSNLYTEAQNNNPFLLPVKCIFSVPFQLEGEKNDCKELTSGNLIMCLLIVVCLKSYTVQRRKDEGGIRLLAEVTI